MTDQDVERFFALDGRERMKMLVGGDYHEYPYKDLGLPNEGEVRGAFAKGEARHLKELVRLLAKRRGGKIGVKEKVEDIVARNCSVGQDGTLVWNGAA